MTACALMLEPERMFAYDVDSSPSASVPGECDNTPRHMVNPFTAGADMTDSIARTYDARIGATR